MTKPNPGPGKPLLDYFPFETIRKSQELVLNEIEKVFKHGKKVIILEAPVGSGKSPIAIAVARWVEANKPAPKANEIPNMAVHLITPRKSLQDQYYSDFADDIVLMKGRNAYPCTHDSSRATYNKVIEIIATGETPMVAYSGVSCSEGPCKDNKKLYVACNNGRPCPYNAAMLRSQESHTVVHNLHSFLYQTNYGLRFTARDILIVDEAHELENTLRDFTVRKFFINFPVKEEEIAAFKTIKDWEAFLLQPKFIPPETMEELRRKAEDKDFLSAKDKYLDKVANLVSKEETYNKGFSINWVPNFRPGTVQHITTTIEFVPHYIGREANKLIFDHGEKILLMSGTIYSKAAFCAALGLNPDETHFVRIPSSFPKGNRPIYMKEAYQTNTSHASWEENFEDMISIIKEISEVFHDVKGLIHAPSYYAANEIVKALDNPRFITHEASNFLLSLDDFFHRKDNAVFISPVCQQGVDFKEDRARFQIILRVPYMSTNTQFVQDMVRKNFPWYNYQALVVFGQQIGRVNRAEDDYGATFLVDSRFKNFIQKNNGVLPTWLKQGLIVR